MTTKNFGGTDRKRRKGGLEFPLVRIHMYICTCMYIFMYIYTCIHSFFQKLENQNTSVEISYQMCQCLLLGLNPSLWSLLKHEKRVSYKNLNFLTVVLKQFCSDVRATNKTKGEFGELKYRWCFLLLWTSHCAFSFIFLRNMGIFFALLQKIMIFWPYMELWTQNNTV